MVMLFMKPSTKSRPVTILLITWIMLLPGVLLSLSIKNSNMKLLTLQEMVEQVFCSSEFSHLFVTIFVTIFCHPLKGNQDIDPNIPVTSENDDATLSILVENSGRINYKLLNNAYMGLHKEGFFSCYLMLLLLYYRF